MYRTLSSGVIPKIELITTRQDYWLPYASVLLQSHQQLNVFSRDPILSNPAHF